MRSKSEEIMQAIVDYINKRYFEERIIPTCQEIADVVGMTKGAVSKYLAVMEERGMITKNATYQGWQTNMMKKASRNLNQLPIVGNIVCGVPILAEQNIESYLTISGDFLGPGNYFVLMAKGNSMINAGIEDGDYVIARQQETADEGQIVVAMVDDGDCTLKRYYVDNKKKMVRLHPENDEMEDMFFTRVAIQGVAIKVIKNLEC